MIPARVAFPGLSALAAALLVVGLVAPSSPAARPPVVGRLSFGEAVFWNGSYSSGEGRWDYRLQILEPGGRLRLAIQTPLQGYSGFYEFRLISPSGHAYSPVFGFTSREMFVRADETGMWKIVVTKLSRGNSVFRMRAKLGRFSAPAGGTAQLLPNLRPEPPFDLRLKLPAWASDSDEPVSCYRYERRTEGARRCLRLSVGPQNIGRGPLQMRFSPLATADESRRMWQRIELSNGDHIERPAGTWEYHPNHGHYHFSGFANLDLLKVGEDGSLTQVGDGHKLGFCLVDFEMAQWERFFQARPNTALNNCGARRNAFMGISRGWIDIYGWGTQGNYVEFSDNTDGLYVVRATVDAQEQILETDETDNVSYAYVSVTGDRVRVLERGYGTDPWDPGKEVVDKWWSALLPGSATTSSDVDRLTRLRTAFDEN